MNNFTKLSIELAAKKDYLDQLSSVYPLSPDNLRSIDPEKWNMIKTAFEDFDNVALIENLLSLPLFPIKDGYVPFLRHDKEAIYRNPKTINRLCGRLYQMGIEELYEKCRQPKETNRQMGPLFKRWLESGALGLKPVDEAEFMADDRNAILSGSDAQLKAFAEKHFGYKRKKGLDLVARFGGRYIIGEAKFISDEGGHQNDQVLDAIQTLEASTDDSVVKVAILDGVLYIPSRRKTYLYITQNDVNVMSALVLKDFLNSL